MKHEACTDDAFIVSPKDLFFRAVTCGQIDMAKKNFLVLCRGHKYSNIRKGYLERRTSLLMNLNFAKEKEHKWLFFFILEAIL